MSVQHAGRYASHLPAGHRQRSAISHTKQPTASAAFPSDSSSNTRAARRRARRETQRDRGARDEEADAETDHTVTLGSVLALGGARGWLIGNDFPICRVGSPPAAPRSRRRSSPGRQRSAAFNSGRRAAPVGPHGDARRELSFFATVATFGTAVEVTTSELSIELAFPPT